MSEDPSKDEGLEALEALDFIINVLKEHEKDLDRLINELGKIAGDFGASGEVATKIDGVERRLASLQAEVTSLVKELSAPKELHTLATRGPLVAFKCKQWEDFKVLAKGAETVSFLLEETKKAFQADALKEGRVLTYNGEFPRDAKLLKLWLARELNVTEDNVFEGA